jgi:hypothetical protein
MEKDAGLLSSFSRWPIKKFLGVYFAYGLPSGYLRKVQFCYQNSIYYGKRVCISQQKNFSVNKAKNLFNDVLQFLGGNRGAWVLPFSSPVAILSYLLLIQLLKAKWSALFAKTPENNVLHWV